MRLKDFLNEMNNTYADGEEQVPIRDHSKPDGAYETHSDEAQDLLDQIGQLLVSHNDAREGNEEQWSHASDMAGVVAKLQEVVDMLSGESDEEGKPGEGDEELPPDESNITEVSNATMDSAYQGRYAQQTVAKGRKAKKEAEKKSHDFVRLRQNRASALAAKTNTIKEGRNSMGESTIANFSKWKAACRAKDASVWFDGDKDICEALVGPNPYKRGETHAIGHFEEGEGGTVYK